MGSVLLHPPSLVARAALLPPVLQTGLQDSAADLLSVAALDLLAEQARTDGCPELALRRAMEAGSLHAVLVAVAGQDAVDACLTALRLRDLDLLAARLCLPAPREAADRRTSSAAA